MKLKRALAFSYFEKLWGYGISLVASIAIARMLTPAEIGTFSVAAVVVGLAGTIRDVGAGTYVVQSREITTAKLRATLGVALLINSAIGLVVVAAAPWIAIFYSNVDVRTALWILALNFVLIPFASVVQALLSREMRFDLIARISVAATTTGAAATVGLAATGGGFASMAWGAVISNAVLAALTIWQRPASMPWRPSLHGARDVIKFGVHSSSQQMMHEMVSGAPDLALGKLAGFHDVGLYSRANGLAQVLGGAVLRGLWPVVLPYFSSATRQERPLREPFKDLTAAVLGLCWPILAVAALCGPDLLRVLFGPPWVEATNALRLLLAAMAVSVLFTLAPQALTAAGAISAVSRIVAWTVVPRLLLIVGGALAGLEAAAGGVLLSNLIFSAALFSVLADRIGLKWIDVGHLVFRNLALVAFSVALPALVYWYMPRGTSATIDEASLRLVLAGLGAMIGFVTGLVRTKHQLLDLIPKSGPVLRIQALLSWRLKK